MEQSEPIVELSSFLILPLFFITTLFSAIICEKRARAFKGRA
jgi:hypothetical protein